MSARHQRDRLEIALDDIRQLRHHVAGDGEGADRPHADGVTVGRRLRDQIEPERERAARAIVDDDGLAQLRADHRRQNARDVVGGAAGRLRNDEPDGAIGIVAGGRGTRHAGDEERNESKPAHVIGPGVQAQLGLFLTARAIEGRAPSLHDAFDFASCNSGTARPRGRRPGNYAGNRRARRRCGGGRAG